MNEKDRFQSNLYRIFSRDEKLDAIPLEELLAAIPTLDSLEAVPAGTTVLVRLDLDVPLKEGAVADFSRLDRSPPGHPRAEGMATAGAKGRARSCGRESVIRPPSASHPRRRRRDGMTAVVWW